MRSKKKKKTLSQYREEFCLDDKKGTEIINSYQNISRSMHEIEKGKKKKDLLIQKARELKKLPASRLKELLENAMEKEGYRDLRLNEPQIKKYVIMASSENDIKEKREGYESIKDIK